MISCEMHCQKGAMATSHLSLTEKLKDRTTFPSIAVAAAYDLSTKPSRT
jgi:hypothetical protein